MFVRVTCAGVLVGTAELDPQQGLAHALLDRTAGYACASSAAWRLARSFDGTQCSPCASATDGDFASVVASRWDGDRLALEDDAGRELAVSSVVLLEGLRGDGATTVRVVVDFRPDLARVGAEVRPRPRTADGGRNTRPAA